MNQLYMSAVDLLLTGGLDLTTVPLKLVPYSWFPFDGYRDNLTDLSSPIPATQPTLTGVAVSERKVFADDATFAAIGEGYDLGALVVATVATGQLVAYIDTQPDRTRIALPGNGGPVTIAWWQGVVIQL
jgi:hypothetical protein